VSALAEAPRWGRGPSSAHPLRARRELGLVTEAQRDADARDARLEAFSPLIAGVARELASTLGVSAERMRQIEQGALDKLRDAAGV
jgi:hypothetical protein